MPTFPSNAQHAKQCKQLPRNPIGPASCVGYGPEDAINHRVDHIHLYAGQVAYLILCFELCVCVCVCVCVCSHFVSVTIFVCNVTFTIYPVGHIAD
jgi:hypothetical protein